MFCFLCNTEAHSPCNCELAAKWLSYVDTESASMNWIISNSKECPKCKNYIERNQGCNSMTCRCGHVFCFLHSAWVCQSF
jgi:ariadne-1